MNIYYSFNDFMNRVMEKADDIAMQNDGHTLEELFGVSEVTLIAIKKLIAYGWYVFMAVTALLLLGWFSFLAALVSFMLTPIGLIVAAIFGVAAAATIKKMYKEKILPLAVRKVGEKYKSRWEAEHPNPVKVDSLLDQAANDLYQKAHQQAIALVKVVSSKLCK